jgi:hypothetical protein
VVHLQAQACARTRSRSGGRGAGVCDRAAPRWASLSGGTAVRTMLGHKRVRLQVQGRSDHLACPGLAVADGLWGIHGAAGCGAPGRRAGARREDAGKNATERCCKRKARRARGHPVQTRRKDQPVGRCRTRRSAARSAARSKRSPIESAAKGARTSADHAGGARPLSSQPLGGRAGVRSGLLLKLARMKRTMHQNKHPNKHASEPQAPNQKGSEGSS